MNRSSRTAAINRFLATLGEADVKTQWQIHAFCLMHHHFHLVLETPQANLVAGMIARNCWRPRTDGWANRTPEARSATTPARENCEV